MSATDPSFLNTFKDGQEDELRAIVRAIKDGTAKPADVQRLANAAVVLLDDRKGAAEYFGEEENQVRHQYLHNNRDDIPLPALEWIARCSRGGEPPYSPGHLEALTWLRELGWIVGALRGGLNQDQELAEFQAKVEPELVAAGIR